MGFFKIVALSSVILMLGIIVHRNLRQPIRHQPPPWKNFGRLSDEEARKAEQDSPQSFVIKVTKDEEADYKRRLAHSRFPSVLSEEVNMTYGFPSHALPQLRDRMMAVDLQLWASKLNSYSHFKVKIMGLDVHYMKIDGKLGLPKVPLLLIHGWPGSVYEFYGAIPTLLEKAERNGFTYDIIVPSLPGYGFSEAPHRPGCNPRYVAAIINELMTSRLGYNRYISQGGDWGAFVTEWIVGLYPERIIGFHVNMFSAPQLTDDFRIVPYLMMSSTFPHRFLSKEEADLVEFKGVGIFAAFNFLFREGGYFHLQATRPDSLGVGLTNSPLGLAAYILEKFYVWTDAAFLEKPIDEATKELPFSIDDALTNILIYWHTNSIQSSVRFYKEAVGDFENIPFASTSVPGGILMTKHEISFAPECVAWLKYTNLKRYTASLKGGHFAALEMPDYFSDEIVAFTRSLL